MAVSDVLIANRALVKIGENRIASLEDETGIARTVNSMYITVRDAELRKYRWRFSQKRAQIAALSAAPAFGYAYQFPLPSDLLRIDAIGTAYNVSLADYQTAIDADVYKLEGDFILSDEAGPLNLRYGSRVTDPSKFDALFVEALACKLAVELAEPLTQSTSKKEMAWNEYKEAIRSAVKVDALEKPAQRMSDTAWIMGRL